MVSFWLADMRSEAVSLGLANNGSDRFRKFELIDQMSVYCFAPRFFAVFWLKIKIEESKVFVRNLLFAAVASVGATALSVPANATTYDAVNDFSTSSSTGVFSYGTGVTGSTFVAYTNYSSPCQASVTGLGCWQTTTPESLVPLVGKNLTGATLNFGTVVLPTNVLIVHPGRSTDSIVRFTVPTTGHYNISGFYELLDTSPTGVNVIIAFNNSVLFDMPLTGPAAMHPGTPGGSIPFGGYNFLLHAGDVIDYGVNNAGNFFNDSTGLGLTFTSVPEPATWTIMLLGFGSVGAAIRRRSRATVTA